MLDKGDVLIAHTSNASLGLTKDAEYIVTSIGKRWVFGVLNDNNQNVQFTMYPDSDGDSYKDFFIKK